MNVWSIRQKKKTGFLPSCGCVFTTEWLHYSDANKVRREKAGVGLHKKATSYFQQILEARCRKNHLYGLLPPIFKTIEDMQDTVREAKTTLFYRPLQMDVLGLVDQQELIYHSPLWLYIKWLI